MPSPFTPKQDAAIRDGLKACSDCKQHLKILADLGLPNEVLEEQQKYLEGVLIKAKNLRDEFAQRPASE